MPRRYGADGTRLWNGKTPEEFTEADAYRFMAETEAVLQRKELMDDPAQPAPASGKEEFYLSKNDDVLLTPEQIAAEERRWLFDAPIAELAEVKGVSIDEAVKMRTDAVLQQASILVVLACCVSLPNRGRRSINLRRRFTVKLTTQELEQMRSVDIGAVAAESLPDVSGMTFDNALSRKERISRFLQTVKNPYCFCIGGVGVKIEFAESGPSLQDKLTDFLLRQRSGL